jgi:hypothetical protein
MSMEPHTKLIQAAARNHLRQLGVFQKGRSRIWLDDRGWFLTIVEFQPSGHSKGTFLNVGAHFLWHESGVLTFDLGHRVEGFTAFESSEQFKPEAERLASRAAEEVRGMRRRLASPGRVAAELMQRPELDLWARFHAAVSLAISGNGVGAVQALGELAEMDPEGVAWRRDLQTRCVALTGIAGDADRFRREMSVVIGRERRALRLPLRDVSLSG